MIKNIYIILSTLLYLIIYRKKYIELNDTTCFETVNLNEK